MDLAERYEFPQIEAVLARHTSQLLRKDDPLQAVEVYRSAGKATDAAVLLAKLAEDAGQCHDVHGYESPTFLRVVKRRTAPSLAQSARNVRLLMLQLSNNDISSIVPRG